MRFLSFCHFLWLSCITQSSEEAFYIPEFKVGYVIAFLSVSGK